MSDIIYAFYCLLPLCLMTPHVEITNQDDIHTAKCHMPSITA